MNEYKVTIGLEVHAELKTATKMFCGCKNDPEEKRPNVNICPICMAHPGTLPVINKKAVEHLVRVGRAMGGTVADFTEFDRKNYFYPDIPKGYQISQYKFPIVSGGNLNGVALTRVHLEEDTARSMHDKGNHTLVDFNRAGVPLMELVTEPVIKSAEEASAFAKELQLLLRYLGASDANMEKGEMRVEANVSVSKGKKLGTKVEIKNLNSFKAVERAIAYEVKRHAEVLDGGGKLAQETRGWDEDKEETFSQREKESSHDYRYFPDPDLPKLKLSELKEFGTEKLPELPWERRARYLSLGIQAEDAEMYVRSPFYGNYFDLVAEALKHEKELVRAASNLIVTDIAGMQREEIASDVKVRPEALAEVTRMFKASEISSRGAKDILALLAKGGGEPRRLAEEKGLFQKSDEGTLVKIAEKVIASNERAAKEFRAGKEASLQFLVGQGMKESKGSANPEALRKALLSLLK